MRAVVRRLSPPYEISHLSYNRLIIWILPFKFHEELAEEAERVASGFVGFLSFQMVLC